MGWAIGHGHSTTIGGSSSSSYIDVVDGEPFKGHFGYVAKFSCTKML